MYTQQRHPPHAGVCLSRGLQDSRDHDWIVWSILKRNFFKKKLPKRLETCNKLLLGPQDRGTTSGSPVASLEQTYLAAPLKRLWQRATRYRF